MLLDALKVAIGIAIFLGLTVVLGIFGAALDIAIDQVKEKRREERKHGKSKKR